MLGLESGIIFNQTLNHQLYPYPSIKPLPVITMLEESTILIIDK